MRILFLSVWFPYPANNGSKLRIYNLLRGLSTRYEVTLLSFADQPDVDPNPPELRQICETVKVVPWKPFAPNSVKARLGFFRITPRSVIDTYSPEMANCIRQTLAEADYDVVIASQVKAAGYSHCFNHLPALFEEVEVGVMYEQYAHASSLASRMRYGFTWTKHRHYLARLLADFQACTVVSSQEQNLLTRKVGTDSGAVAVIPNCVNVNEYADVCQEPQPNTLIFTGSFSFYANYNAMTWFLQDVYPYVLAQAPEVQVTITGNHGDKPLPTRHQVELTGFVDDVRPYIARSWISLAPILEGGGTRLKILEAMALRTPVVATSKGAEGLDVRHEEHILIADSPQEYAAAVIRLLQDSALRRRLAENAYNLVCQKYDWTAVMPRFLQLVERVASA